MDKELKAAVESQFCRLIAETDISAATARMDVNRGVFGASIEYEAARIVRSALIKTRDAVMG